MRKLQLILGVIFVTGFIALGVIKIVHGSTQTFRFSDFELKNTNEKLQELESKYNVQLKDLDRAIDDVNTSKEKSDRLKAEKEKAEKERDKAKAQLQAKIDLKNKLAKGSEKVIDAVTNTKVVGASAEDNKSITWNYLISQGFSRNQTAGIMGNLQQEHGFRTDGDGLAQWTAGRKANMLSRPDPYSIHSQLAYLMEELNGGYIGAKNSILVSSSVEDSTVAFQNQFERCGNCRESQRISYAYKILAQY